MKHTFLFLEGTWLAEGVYYDSFNNEISIEGKSVVSHKENNWKTEGYMKLLIEEPVEIQNNYDIVPFESDFTTWKSENPDLGTLIGRFAIVDDTIISTFNSSEGEHFGSECLTKISDKEYKCRGYVFIGNVKLSSWAVNLILQDK